MPQVTPVLGAACPAVVGDGARDGTKGRTQNRSVQLPPDEDAYTCCPSAYGYRMLMGEFSQPEGGFTGRLRDGSDFGARRARSMAAPSLTIVRAGRLELPRPCGHQDLNLARLPVPPRSRRTSLVRFPGRSIL